MAKNNRFEKVYTQSMGTIEILDREGKSVVSPVENR